MVELREWAVGSYRDARARLKRRLPPGVVNGLQRRIPAALRGRLVGPQYHWSIGILAGSSLFDLQALPPTVNPILTPADVTDMPAVFVADPFGLRVDGRWYLFFEVLNLRTGKGEIGLAVSEDARSWRYLGIVLRDDVHLSYPHVFEWAGERYMVPESSQARVVRLYRAVDFPTRWVLEGHLLAGGTFLDPSIFRHHDRWWMFAETNPMSRYDTLRLFSADRLMGPWREHPESPVVRGDARMARPGGRVVQVDGRLVRFGQDCTDAYGDRVYAIQITNLSRNSYEEARMGAGPVLEAGGEVWNQRGMHHIDAHRLEDGRWLAFVDGKR